MLHRLIDCETAVDAPAAAGGVPAGGDLSPEGVPAVVAPGETAPPAVVTDTAPAVAAGLDEDTVLDLIRQQLGPIAQMLEGVARPAAEGAPVAAPTINLDPFSETYAADLAAFLAQRDEQFFAKIDQRLSGVTQPFEQAQAAAARAEGEQRAQDVIADDLARNGDLPTSARDQIWPLATLLYPEFAARYGESDRAAEMAIAKGAGIMRSIVAEAKASAVEEYKNQLGTLGGAPRELGGQGVAGAEGLRETTNPSEITKRFAAQARDLRATGAV